MDWSFGRWRVRICTEGSDLDAALALRAKTFRAGGSDVDAFDRSARHLVIADAGGVKGYARLWVQSAAEMAAGYSGQFYDLAPVLARHARAVEIGRVALAPDEVELPRVLLAALTQVVDQEGASLLYGCASSDADAMGGLGGLTDRVSPSGPGRKAPEIVELPTESTAPLPTLLRLYLSFGAEISDHAVRDRDLGTVHVLAMLPLASIPPARARLLRALAPEPQGS
jgi:putative hemolysin